LTKLVSQMSREGHWAKSLEVNHATRTICAVKNIHFNLLTFMYFFMYAGLTKLVSQMSREGHWANSLEVSRQTHTICSVS
jgi:hypothetical protein